MQQLIDLISNNFGIVITILAAIFGLFGASAGKNNEKGKKTAGNQPQTTQNPSQTTSGQSQMSQGQMGGANTASSQSAQDQIEKQQNEQMEKLRGQFQKQTSEEAQDFSDMKNASQKEDGIKEMQQQLQKKLYEQGQFKQEMRNNLGRKGLVQGIIMSEVLGPPRSRKRYRNIARERMENK